MRPELVQRVEKLIFWKTKAEQNPLGYSPTAQQIAEFLGKDWVATIEANRPKTDTTAGFYSRTIEYKPDPNKFQNRLVLDITPDNFSIYLGSFNNSISIKNPTRIALEGTANPDFKEFRKIKVYSPYGTLELSSNLRLIFKFLEDFGGAQGVIDLNHPIDINKNR